jgi:uncharacterized protein (TIGR03435 family)
MNNPWHEIIVQFHIEPVGTAMPGPRLPHRIRKITDAAPIVRISSARAASLIAVCITVCSVFFGVTMRAQSSGTLAWEKVAGGKMSFEAASIKLDTAEPDEQNTYSNVLLDSQGFFTPTGGLFRSGNRPLTAYIAFAYKLTRDQLHDLSSRLPKWVSTQRWDIDGRAAGNPTKDQYRLMMQSLLAARFNMAVHFETQRRPALALKLQNSGKLGPRLQPHRADVPCSTVASGGWPVQTVADGFPKPCGSVMWGPAATQGQFYMGARDVPMAMIANALSFQPAAAVDRTVVDETGLAGNFDFTLRFSPPMALETRSGDVYEPDPEGASFTGALKQQLGLTLSSTTAPVSEIVIDHIEEPTPN